MSLPITPGSEGRLKDLDSGIYLSNAQVSIKDDYLTFLGTDNQPFNCIAFVWKSGPDSNLTSPSAITLEQQIKSYLRMIPAK